LAVFPLSGEQLNQLGPLKEANLMAEAEAASERSRGF
jgi:hypothetical protein